MSNQENVHNLIILTNIVRQIVPSESCTKRLTIRSQMEILKAKTRNLPQLAHSIEDTLKHMDKPKYI
jgi:hypothetical protein